MFISVTRLRVRSLLYLPSFLWTTFGTQKQTVRAAGFLGGRLLVDRRNTYWTLTVWETEKAMKAFRGSGPHARVMPKLVNWCDEAAYTHWMTETDSIPQWAEAYERLLSEGRLSRVSHPSADHTARHFPEPRLNPPMARDLKPA